MMSAWQEYKKKLGDTRPWDMVTQPKVAEDVSEKRMAVCLECPELIQMTKQCKQCGCFMNMKVRLEKAVCPLGKW
jgi:sucrose-6-phosphate hydrolase SacC (GH32 family)